MTLAQLLAALHAWRLAGGLRALDLAFARFVAEQAPDTPPSLLLAAALASRMEGHGHVCLPLDLLAANAGLTLELSPSEKVHWAPLAPLVSTGPVVLASAWKASSALDHAATDTGAPLVLHGPRLYLARHWRDERDLAAAVRARVATGRIHDDSADSAGRDVAAEEAAWLDRVFATTPATAPDAGQRAAAERSLHARLLVVTGGPGTGKTYTAARVLALHQALHAVRQERAAAVGAAAVPPLRVALAAPTGKAAARLQAAIENAAPTLSMQPQSEATAPAVQPRARTLHGWLGARADGQRWRHDAAHPLDVDLMVVDEASMVHLELMAALLRALPPHALLVLLGDADQLASVEAGAVLAALARSPALASQTVALRRSHRFGGAIAELAAAVNTGDTKAMRRVWSASGSVADGAPAGQADLFEDGRVQRAVELSAAQIVAAGYGALVQAARAGPAPGQDHGAWVAGLLAQFDRLRVLCALREGPRGVAGVNRAIEAELQRAGLIDTPTSPHDPWHDPWHDPLHDPWYDRWYDGRPVLVTRNTPAAGVFNGDIGLALRGPTEPTTPTAPGARPPGRLPGQAGAPSSAHTPLRVWFTGPHGPRAVAPARLPDTQTAWALTVHKSQGSEFDHVMLVLPEHDSPVLTRELLYTAITRARRRLTLVGASDAVLARAAARPTLRASGLPDLLAGR